MLSTYLHMTQEYRNYLINYLELSKKDLHTNINEISKLWLHSAKIPPYGEGLADKGFEHTDALFA